MNAADGPDPYPRELFVRQVERDETIEAFRAVEVPDTDDPDLPLSFRSHYEVGLAPQPAENQHAAIYMAVSFWTDSDIVIGLAQRFSKLGRYLARLELVYGYGFDRLDPSAETNRQHLTIWGTRERLAQVVVDIVPIDSP